MQEDPKQREDEEREASDEPVVEGNRDDSVAGHMIRFEPGRHSEPGMHVADKED